MHDASLRYLVPPSRLWNSGTFTIPLESVLKRSRVWHACQLPRIIDWPLVQPWPTFLPLKPEPDYKNRPPPPSLSILCVHTCTCCCMLKRDGSMPQWTLWPPPAPPAPPPLRPSSSSATWTTVPNVDVWDLSVSDYSEPRPPRCIARASSLPLPLKKESKKVSTFQYKAQTCSSITVMGYNKNMPIRHRPTHPKYRVVEL